MKNEELETIDGRRLQRDQKAARIEELEAALAEAREDAARLQSMEDGKLSCQYRGGATPSMHKWIVAYSATPIAGGSTLRAAIDAARGRSHASK